jgi:hypothetical protein
MARACLTKVFSLLQDAFASQFPEADIDVNVLFRRETEKKRGSVRSRIFLPF